MYQYRLNSTNVWLAKLLSIHESGTIIGLPKSGKHRTVESAIEDIGLQDRFLTLDLSITPKKFKDFVSQTRPLLVSFTLNNGQIIYLKNCSISTRSGLTRLKALKSLRLESGRKFIFIYEFSQDIELKKSIITRHGYLADILSNLLYFPYANESEFDELIIQNTSRFSVAITPNLKKQIYLLTGGVPFLIKAVFRLLSEGEELTVDNLKDYSDNLLSLFSAGQIHDLKNLAKLSVAKLDSYQKLCLLDSESKIISNLLRLSLDNYNLTQKLFIDIQNHKIILGNLLINSELNSYDQEILYYLTKNRRITREEVAAICYGSRKSQNYSDYAIDKIVSRLRTKLVQLGASPNSIKAIRGFGYCLHNNE